MTYLLFGVKLQVFRGLKQWSQQDASRKVGMTLKAYQHIEEGQHEPVGGTVKQIERGLGINFEPEDFRVKVPSEVADTMLGRVAKKEWRR